MNADADEAAVATELKGTSFPTNQVEEVSTKTPYANPNRGFKVVLVDFGAKLGIIRELSQRNCDIIVVSQDTTAEEILLMNPDGIMLSNGPGDPEDVPHALDMIRGLLGKVPIFGICLGHQLIGLACGAKTFKLKFGHRGGNHPVLDLEKYSSHHFPKPRICSRSGKSERNRPYRNAHRFERQNQRRIKTQNSPLLLCSVSPGSEPWS